MKFFFIVFYTFSTSLLLSQSYNSYFTGSSNDTITQPIGGVCMMGGATESHEAMQWFLTRADGGDILVLRVGGEDGYNDYMYSELGINVNSVETIVCNNSSSALEPYILDKIDKAEGIWFPGGDQWNYVSYWRGTQVAKKINQAISERNIVVGGTSAGMAILGEYYFSAENGTVNSEEALNNPYHDNITLDSIEFLRIKGMENVITDTHYDSRERKGRHCAFLARLNKDYGVNGIGLACDEYTAICIDNESKAVVYGDHPTYNDNAYFIFPNCKLSNGEAEKCLPSEPLEWNRAEKALMVYQVKGTKEGANYIDLKDMDKHEGGEWTYWSVKNGKLEEKGFDKPNCLTTQVDAQIRKRINIYPNPSYEKLSIETGVLTFNHIYVSTINGRIKLEQRIDPAKKTFIDVSHLRTGTYVLTLRGENKELTQTFIKSQ